MAGSTGHNAVEMAAKARRFHAGFQHFSGVIRSDRLRSRSPTLIVGAVVEAVDVGLLPHD